jgi:micrococcal nuclease
MNPPGHSPSLPFGASLAILLAAFNVAAPRSAAAGPPQRTARRGAAARALKRAEVRTQTRPYGLRVPVDPARIFVDDGDTVTIRWPDRDIETVRVLGIDAPETRHPEHDVPFAQPFGPEAQAFARGVFAGATRVELLRAAILDDYGRSLGYLFANGRNYSVLLVRARLAVENVSHFGDNGFPAQATEVLAAAKTAGPLPFERPHVFRARMRELSRWMKAHGGVGEP